MILTEDEIIKMRDEVNKDYGPKINPPRGREYWDVSRIVETLEYYQQRLENGVNRLGLTEKEQKVMDKLLNSYTAFLALPKQHPDEISEFGYAVHLIQGLLTTRIARRNFPKGWPTYDSTHNR